VFSAKWTTNFLNIIYINLGLECVGEIIDISQHFDTVRRNLSPWRGSNTKLCKVTLVQNLTGTWLGDQDGQQNHHKTIGQLYSCRFGTKVKTADSTAGYKKGFIFYLPFSNTNSITVEDRLIIVHT